MCLPSGEIFGLVRLLREIISSKEGSFLFCEKVSPAVNNINVSDVNPFILSAMVVSICQYVIYDTKRL